jgi:hypothetical protein
MYALSTTELLEIWERGQGESPLRRALLLLAAACHDTPADRLARWSIGRRDAELLRIHEQIFGADLASQTACPACREPVEFQMRCSDLLESATEPAPETLRGEYGEWAAEFRLPASLDLEALDPQAGAEINRRALLTNCMLSLRHAGQPVAFDALPLELESVIVAEMVRADPHAEFQLDLGCQACGHRWQVAFDVISYLWAELHAWAARLLREVHTLASSYGWSEADILALSARRRQFYLGCLRE